MSLAWKLNRLRAMGLGELSYRLHQAAQARWERLLPMPSPPAPRGHSGSPWLEVLPRAFDVAPYLAAAERFLQGHFDVFALGDAALGFPPDWNRDPKTGTTAPRVFGKTLNYRDEAVVGDIKYLWEINRHLELVTLAQAYHLSGDMRFAEGVRELLESWFDQCPYPLGPNWTSSLEHAVRLANWSVTWHLLGCDRAPLFKDEAGAAFRSRWLHAIYLHCRFIAGHFSRHSSANNHLFGEYMGLYLGATVWPLWDESTGWQALARQGLEEETQRQNAADGVNREQAFWYLHEVADMMLLCGLYGRANGAEFSTAFWARLEAMLAFVASLIDTAGNVPQVGDADDAVMVRWVPGRATPNDSGFNVYRSLLATGAVIFARADFKQKASAFDEKSRWLLGDGAAARFDALSADTARAPQREFPQGGYWLLGDALDTPGEIRVLADAGPLGYLSIAAHGHADALAFTLSAGGQEVLIDPGTYAYHTEKHWRDYFRGTAAHNTVQVDGLDQSVAGGNFLWLRHTQARCLKFETTPEQDLWEGEHDGYKRLDDPVTHKRRLVLDKAERALTVTDTLECKDRHTAALHWHFAEGCVLELHGNTAVARCGKVRITIALPPEGGRAELVRGAENPPLGWISRRFDEKYPTCCLRWATECQGTKQCVTRIEIQIEGDGQ